MIYYTNLLQQNLIDLKLRTDQGDLLNKIINYDDFHRNNENNM